MAGQAKPSDLVIVAFFGEGGPLGKSGDRRCYFAVDSTFAGRDKDALAADDIGDVLKKCKSEHFCAFVDVNFKGFDVGKDAVPDANVNKFYQEFFSKVDKGIFIQRERL